MLYITDKGKRRLAELDEGTNLEGWILKVIWEHPGQFPAEAWLGDKDLEGRIYDSLKDQLLEEGLLVDR